MLTEHSDKNFVEHRSNLTPLFRHLQFDTMPGNEQQLKCGKCAFTTRYDFSLSRHVKHSHRNIREEDFKCNVAFIEKFQCPDGDYDSQMKVDFDIHLRSRHAWGFIQEGFNPEEWACLKCDFKTFSNFLALRHNCKQELKLQSEIVMNKKYIIESDELYNTIKNNLKDFKTRWIYCDQCPYKTVRRINLQRHTVKVHLPETKKFKCDRCSFKASSVSYVNRHIKMRHAGDKDMKWFQCGHCSFKTIWNESLCCHIKARHGSKDDKNWFKCDQCSFKSRKKYNVKTHVDSQHGSVNSTKFFYCDHCDFKAMRELNVKRHVTYQHTPRDEIKWFRCEQCSYKSKLKFHLNRHNNSKHTASEKQKSN